MALSQAEALQTAISMRKQGLSYPDIEQHLKKSGYVSPFTKKPIGHLAVRKMVMQAIEKRQSPKVEVDVSEVAAPKADIMEAIKALTEMKTIDINVKLRLIQHLIKTSETY